MLIDTTLTRCILRAIAAAVLMRALATRRAARRLCRCHYSIDASMLILLYAGLTLLLPPCRFSFRHYAAAPLILPHYAPAMPPPPLRHADCRLIRYLLLPLDGIFHVFLPCQLRHIRLMLLCRHRLISMRY